MVGTSEVCGSYEMEWIGCLRDLRLRKEATTHVFGLVWFGLVWSGLFAAECVRQATHSENPPPSPMSSKCSQRMSQFLLFWHCPSQLLLNYFKIFLII